MENRNENIRQLMEQGIPQKSIAQKYRNENIRQLYKQKLTQKEIAEKIGISRQRICDIINDKIGPKMWTQARKERQQERRQERREKLSPFSPSLALDKKKGRD